MEERQDLISRQAAIDAAKHAWAKGLEPSQYIEIIPPAQPKPCESDEAAKRLNDLISDINPWEICSQIESDNLSDWCKTIQTEMKMAMVQCKELGIDDSGKQVEFYIWEDEGDES